MDFDSAWCPACDRQIQPKRITITVPATTTAAPPPPPPPSSPRRSKGTIRQKTGLVNGTGRVRPNGTIRPAPPPATKQRTIIDQGPIPLYCSDQCQLADLHARRTTAPIDPSREDPTPAATIRPKKQPAFTTAGSETESDSSSSTSPPKPLTSMEKFAAMYNFPPLPPPPPSFDEPTSDRDFRPNEYNCGVMMAGKLISSLCPPPAKPHVGPYRPAPEPRKPIPGWTDGSNAWRSTVYSFTSPQNAQDPFHRDTPAKAYGSFSASSQRSRSVQPTLSAPNEGPSYSQSDDMINKFSQNFSRRSESRASLYAGSASGTATPSSPASSHSLPSPRRERSLVPPSAEGKLLVPNVKMKVHCGSSASLSSAWSGPTSVSSRKSIRSPLSATSDTEEENETCDGLSIARPGIETRSWSYDNVKTYPIMQLPPKKVKKMQTQIVDGEERQVEVEVEVLEERKRLFLFAPTRISR